MNMISTLGRLLPIALSSLLGSLAIAQVPLTLGNLVVVRIGDNVNANSSAANPVFLDEYTPTGTLVQTIAMPTVPSGLNYALTNSGTATSEGLLNVSTNGFYFTLGGYDAAVGTAAVATTANPGTARVLGRVDLLGTVDTSTTITDAFSGVPVVPTSNGNIRSVFTDDGNRFWATGSLDGVRFVANLGDSTSIGLNGGAPFNTRGLQVFHDDLYITAASGITQGVARVGSGGLPTTPGQAIFQLPGFPMSAGPSTYDMFWANPTTVYTTDDAVNGGGGIKKWELIAGTWVNSYILAQPLTGNYGLTGFVQNGVTTLWATARPNTPALSTPIVSVVDTGPGSVFTTIVPAPAMARFRGIRRVGLPTNVQKFLVGCGGPTGAGIKMTGNGEMGTDMFTSVTNSFLGFTLIGYGLIPAFFPFCSCTIGHEYLVVVGGPDHTLNIVPSWATLGLTIYGQAVDLLAPNGCPDPTLTLTDVTSFTVQ